MRIVTHTCSNTEIVCALGRANWLVGVDDHSDYPAEVVRGLPRIGPDLDVDIQRICALRPDLVITSLTVPGHERCVERIVAAGLPHLVTHPTCLADVAADIRRIGAALRADHEAERIASRFDHLPTAATGADRLLPVLVEWWPKPVIVPGARSWVNEMLRVAGARNPWEACDSESLTVDADAVRRAAPEAVIMSWCGVDETKYRAHVVRRRAGWSDVPAVVHDQIHAVSEAWLGRPGPRLWQGIDRLRTIVASIRSASAATGR